MTDLLPCPFCGAQPYQRIELNPNGAPYPDHHVIWCENLDCPTSPETFEITLEESVQAWNTRAAPQPLSNPLEGKDREAIARIVEPLAFIPETTHHSRVWKNDSLEVAKAAAYAKADAILSFPAEGGAREAGNVSTSVKP